MTNPETSIRSAILLTLAAAVFVAAAVLKPFERTNPKPPEHAPVSVGSGFLPFVEPSPQSGSHPGRWTVTGFVMAQHAQPWVAKQHIERRVGAIRDFASRHGGSVRLEASRYMRSRTRTGSPEAAGNDFTIVLELRTDWPGAENRETVLNRLLLLGFVPEPRASSAE